MKASANGVGPEMMKVKENEIVIGPTHRFRNRYICIACICGVHFLSPLFESYTAS